jgi:hypothetical protein
LEKIEIMEDKARYYKSLFVTYFDGCYGVDREPNVSNTYAMGVCKLDYVEEDNKLIVYLRRPGLLIGKGGRIINAVKKQLDINIDIIEIVLEKAQPNI